MNLQSLRTGFDLRTLEEMKGRIERESEGRTSTALILRKLSLRTEGRGDWGGTEGEEHPSSGTRQ